MQGIFFPFPGQFVARQHGNPPVGRTVVVLDRKQFSVDRLPIRPSALLQPGSRQGLVQHQVRPEAALMAQPQRYRIGRISFLPIIFIGIKAGRMPVAGRYADPFPIPGSPGGEGPAGPIFHRSPSTLPDGRSQGRQAQDAGHRVAAVQGSLRPAQQVCTPDVQEIEIIQVFVQDGNIIDIQPENGIVDAGAETAQIDRRCHGRAIVRDVQVRNDGREGPGAAQASLLHLQCKGRCEGRSQFVEPESLLHGSRHGRGRQCISHFLVRHFRPRPN